MGLRLLVTAAHKPVFSLLLDHPMSDKYRKLNYDISTAIDMIKLSIALVVGEETGLLSECESRTFKVMASSLLTAIRNAAAARAGEDQNTPIV